MEYRDARNVVIEMGDKVLLTNTKPLRIGTVVGFKEASKPRPRFTQVGPRVVVETDVNERPVMISSYRWSMVCIRQLAKDIL